MNAKYKSIIPQRLVCGVAALITITGLHAEDWPMLGRDKTRNSVSPEKGAPVEWDVKTGRNIKWRAKLGNATVSQPIVSGGLIWIGTNNDEPRDSSQKEEGGVLACFRERDGAFLYQHVSIVTNRRTTDFGMTGSPMAEGNRLWFVSTTAEILCLETALLRSAGGRPKLVWRLNMEDDLGIYPAVDIMGGKGVCSIGSAYDDLIYVITGNGKDWRSNIPAPLAPALVCVNKNTGKIVWKDNSPGTNIVFGEFASPLIIEAGGVPQVIAPQGDGWVRSFEAKTGELLWKFDINPKAAIRRRDDRDFFLNSPVFYQGRVYIAGGRDSEWGAGPGRLVCIDPTKRGDLSLEIEDRPGKGKSNPNSGAVWNFDELGRTMSNVAIHDGLLVAVDYGGHVYCLDTATGRKHWKHDMGASVRGSPLVADGKIYIGNEDGDFYVFELAREKKLLFTTGFDAPVYSSPIFANGVLYLVTNVELFAIQQGASSPSPKPTRP